MSQEILYHIFVKNNTCFLIDSYNQLFWKQDFCKEKTENIEQLSRYGFFKENKFENQKNKVNNSISIRQLVINPSTLCNLDCWFCYSRKFREENKDELNLEDIEKIIDLFVLYNKEKEVSTDLMISLGYTQELSLDFSLFIEIKKYIESLVEDINFNILLFPPSTNLIQINQDFIDFTNAYGYLTVSLDLENKDQKNAIYTNLPKFAKNVEKHLVIPLKADNINLYNLYKDYSCLFDYVSIRLVRVDKNSKYPWNEQGVTSLNAAISDLFKDLLRKSDKEIIRFLRLLGPTDYIARYIDRVISRTKVLERCPAGKSAITIAPNLDLYPCSGMIGYHDLKVGEIDIKKGHIEFDYERLNSLSFEGQCLTCPIRFYCGGSCLDWLYKQFGNLNVANNFYECKLNKHLVEEIIFFLSEIIEKRSEIYQTYIKLKGLKNGLNYPLDFDAFCEFFKL